MRNLSIKWMDRIAVALEIEPELLVRSESATPPQVVAVLTDSGADGLRAPRDAIIPTDLGGDMPLVVLSVETSSGEYRPGDQVWLRQIGPDDTQRAINRDVLVPRKGGRFAFGRLIDRQGTMLGILPPGSGQKQQVVDDPAWLAVAEMLVRKL